MKIPVRRLFLIAALCPLVVLSIARSSAQEPPPKKPLTIEAIFAEGGIVGRAPESVQWSPDNSKVAYIQRDDSAEHGQLWYVDTTSGEKKILVNEIKLAAFAPPVERIKDEREKERVTRYHVEPYHWAPDSKHLIFAPNGQLWMYDVESGTAVQFALAPDPARDPKFSPDGNRVSYLRKHNLYVRPISGDSEKQLTNDKDENLLNGEVDWVYAEELDVRSNYFWSPDSKQIAFLQMDETKVPTYPIVDWMSTHPSVDLQKYPQAGDPNPAVRLGVINADGGKPKWISLTSDQDVYIPRFGWVRDGVLWAEVLNRRQDQMDLYFIDAHSGRSRKVFTETESNAWVKVNDDFKILKSGDRFLWSSWQDGTTQLYLYSFDKSDPLASDAKLELQLTKGDFEVLGVEAVDEDAGVVYFTCNKDDPRQRQLYSVKLDGSYFRRVSQEDGTHEPKFSDDGKHYVDNFSAVSIAPRMSICNAGSSCKQVWDSRSVNDFALIPPKFMEFKAEDGTTLYGELLLPAESNRQSKIPLVVYIYGGPAAQTVIDKFPEPREWLFHEILAQHGFAVFSVDNRGTPGRDRKFMTAVRHEYGKIELKDQLTSLDPLFAQYPQLDRSRVAIWGWSNGASMTLYAMTHSDLFKAGVSVAPVTDWHNYDSIYTERNNGLPTDKDSTSYTDMDLPKAAKQLHGSLLLVHGTGDDNVHFQNSIQMIEGLLEAGKQFRFMAYPQKTHSISGSVDRTHLFRMIEDHFERELK